MSEEIKQAKNIFSKKRLFIIIAVFIFIVIAVYSADVSLGHAYQNKYLPNIKIAGIDIGGLTVEEARAKLDKRIDFVNRRGFVYTSDIKTVTINSNSSGLESGESLDLIVSWDLDKSLRQVNSWQNKAGLLTRLTTFLKSQNFYLYYNWDKEEHLKILEDSFKDVLTQKQEATFSFATDNTLQIINEQAGQTFNYQRALEETQKQIETLISNDIALQLTEDRPEISSKVIEEYEQQIIGISHRGGLYLTFEDQEWFIPNNVWKNWLKLKKDANKYYVGVDKEKFQTYLEEAGIFEVLNVPVKDARFSLQDGRVSEFISSQEGRTIQMDKSITDLDKILNTSGELELALSVITVEPNVSNDDVNDLGIVEIIGTGQSDFSGSPSNRIHNIHVGADSLQGVLIKPGDTFSLISALGEIDGEHGYLQELVIKGDKTIPEYGGGLCQIGTTVFRATLASGLPVVERRNHSYRVSYYEPAGTDATIYSPWPDYKFKNDTNHHILIQTRIEGTKLYFDFWGTEDGRVAMTTQPEIYNIVAPPEKKIIKTTEIPAGTTKCTERAHNGADAKFNYSVQYAGQPEPVENTFYSHYIPWQEVCLLGVTEEELLAEQEQSNSTSTPEE